MVVASQPVFQLDFRCWILRPSADQTWPKFISFFREAHHEMREIETSMEELGYQLANTIVSQIVNELHQVEDNNQLEPAYENETMPIQEYIPQANVTQDMAALMLTMV